MTTFDEAIELALRTWYPEGHELRLNPHHPTGKLLGEWGELLDDYMKSLYKPDYKFDSVNELGDIWYYVRILAYQFKIDLGKVRPPNIQNGESLEIFITSVMNEITLSFILICDGITPSDEFIGLSFNLILVICERYNMTIDDLTRSNWEKLKPGSERGEEWMKARVLNVD